MLRSYHPLQKSFTGKYLVTIIEAIVEKDSGRNAAVHENTILIFSDSAKDALEEVIRLRGGKRPEYKGEDGRIYFEQFCGVSRLSPIHEELTSGAEVAWLDLTGICEESLRRRIAGTTVEEIFLTFDRINEENSEYPL